MAKKESHRFDDDLDFGFDDSDYPGGDPFLPEQSQSSGRNPVTKASSSLLRGMRDETKNVGFYKNILKAALPESFTTTLDSVDYIADMGSRSYTQAMREARPVLQQTRKIAASINRLVPTPFQNKIDEYLKSKDRAANATHEIDMEEASVSQSIGDMFKEQEQDDRKVEQAEKLVEYVDTKEYRKSVIQQLNSINRQLSLQTENQLRVQRAWQHKTLEVQLRQLFVQRGLLNVTRKGMEENSMLLRDIVKNTALPDIQKEQRSETLGRLTRERLFGAAQSRVSDWARSNQYLRAVGERFNKAIADRMRSFQMGLQSGAEMFESVEEQMRAAKEFGIDPNEMAAELAGGSISTRLGKWVGGKVGKRLNLKKADNFFRSVNFRKDMLGHYLSNYGKNLKNNGSRLGEWFGNILDVPFTNDTTIANGRLADMDARAGRLNTDDRKLQALEVTLPGFLSRILQEVTSIRTGTPQDRIVFDPQKGSFTTMRDSVDSLSQRILSDSSIAQSQSSLNELISRIGGKDITRKERNELAEYLRSKSKDQRWAFDPESLLDPENKLSLGLRNRLTTNLSSRYGLVEDDATGRMRAPLTGLSGINELEADARSYNQFRDYSHDVYRNVKAIHSLGGIEQLLQAGAVHWDDNSQTYELNPEYIERRSNAKFKQQNWRSGSLGSNSKTSNGDTVRSGYDFSGNDSIGYGAAAATVDDSEGNSSSSLKRFLGRDKPNSIIRAIRDLNESLLDAIDNMPVRDVQEEQADILTDILNKLHSGIDTNATGTGTGQRKTSLFKRVGRGIRGAAKAGWRIGGLPFKAMRALGRTLTKPFKYGGRKLLSIAGGIKDSITGKARKLMTDVYVMGQEGLKRVIEASLMRAGGYTDVNTGKVIKTWKDITGAVINNTTGNIVLTQEEFDKGLMNSMGERVRTSILGLGKRLIKGIGKFAISPIAKPLSWAAKGINAVRKLMMMPPDVYLRGQMDKPVLYGQQMYNGMYWSNTTNKVIRYVGDIDGDIYTWDNESKQKRIVLTAQQIQDPGLVDANGKPLVGFMKKWKDRIGSAIGLITKNLNPLTWLRRGKGLISKAGKAVAGLFGGVGSNIGGISGSWPKRIYTLLWNKFNNLPLDQDLATGAGGIGMVRKAAGYVRDKFGNMLSGSKKAISGLLSGIFRPGIASKFMSLFSKGKSRVKDRVDDEKNRQGSWVNRIANLGNKAKKILGAKDPITNKFPWLKLIMGGFGLVTGALSYIRKKFMSWGGKLLGWIPKIVKAIGNSRIASSAIDAVGSLAGGKLGKVGKVLKNAGGKVLKWGSKLAGPVLKNVSKIGGSAARAVASTAGRAVVRTGLTLATRLLPMLSNPYFLLGAVVAAGVGYIIYKGYKAYTNRITSVREMRLAQYGFARQDDSDKLGKVLALEEACLKAVKFDSMGVPTLGEVKYNDLMDAFGISEAAEKSRLNWATWYVKRFRPVFLHNVKCIHDIDPKGNITDPLAGLPKGKLPDYALASRLPDNNKDGTPGPYFIDAAPFLNTSCSIGTGLVDSTIQKVVAEFKKERKELRTEERKRDNLGNEENKGFGAAKGTKMAPGMQFKAKADNRLYDTSEASKAVGTITGNIDTDKELVANNVIDNVTSVRMRLYGMMELKRTEVNTIMRMEETLIDENIVIRDKTAVFNGNVDTIINTWAPIYGIALTDKEAIADWRMWFNNRFLPVFLNFCTRGNKWVGLANLVSKVRQAHPERQYSIAEFMSIATSTINGEQKSVWVVSSYPFPEESANTDSLIIRPIMEAMRLAIKEKAYRDQLAVDAGKGKIDSKKQAEMRKAVADYATAHPDAARAFTYNQQSGSTAINTAGGEVTNGIMSNIGEGTGVNAAGIPVVDGQAINSMKDVTERAKALLPVFQAVSKMTGVDVNTLMAFVNKESSFLPLVRAKAPPGVKATAGGLMQFIDSTWNNYIPKLEQLGFKNPSKFEPAAAITAGALYIKENSEKIKSVLGTNPSVGELYLGHFLGGGGASKLLSMGNDEDWSTSMPDVKKSNPNIYKVAPTVGALRRWANDSMAGSVKFSQKISGIQGTMASTPVNFQTNTGPMTPPADSDTSAGSAPLKPGSVPLTPESLGSAGSAPTKPASDGGGARSTASPTALDNIDALTSNLPAAASEPAIPKPSPVDPGRANIARQQARQNQSINEVAQKERVAARSADARNTQAEVAMQDTRTQSGLRERITAATEASADTLSKILDYLNASGKDGNVTTGNMRELKNDMLMKNANMQKPVGRPRGDLPFSTSN